MAAACAGSGEQTAWRAANDDFRDYVTERSRSLLRTAYLLTGNYRVILDYNCSNFYAMSVGVLADAIVR